MTTKDKVRKILDQLPDNCTMEDVQYALRVVEKIERGLAAADAGQTISHEEASKILGIEKKAGEGTGTTVLL